jgi:AhpD family alkylhydroperoxidase
MQTRMKHPVFVIPDAREALLALDRATANDGLPDVTRELVHLRASQINGCSVCVGMHARKLKDAGQEDMRIFAVVAWRDTPYFSDAERAALALTEEVTRLADRPEAVSDAVWAEAKGLYDETALAALILQIAKINLWNRLNATIRQMAGQAWN